MTTNRLYGWLRATISTAALALAPGVVHAHDTDASTPVREPAGIPDHAQAEARAGGATTTARAEVRESVPDHAQAEDRGTGATIVPGNEAAPGVPDHAQAEARSGVSAPPSR
jgi:hypothetical protein